jgi:hypothetical protein
MTRDDVTGLAFKLAITAFAFGFVLWYITMKCVALRHGGP